MCNRNGEKKMPPEVSCCRSSVSSLPHFSSTLEPKLDPFPVQKCCRPSERMSFTKKKLLPVLLVILASLSVLRLLRIAIETTASTSLPRSNLLPCSSKSTCWKARSASKHHTSAKAPALTEKEVRYLSNIISQKAPCNLLVFGLDPLYLALASVNAGGFTLILEDDPEKLNSVRNNFTNTSIYKVDYHIPARKAYEVLQHARQNPACYIGSESLQKSNCPLALTKLPREVYKLNWDVLVVDGPNGDRPDAPGRMATIYTARIIARSGNKTHVVIHDVNRMIEKWFSWEFLCEENMVSSKGNFWDFEIAAQSNSTRFCSPKTI